MFVGKIGDVAKNSKLSVIDGTTMALGYRSLAIDLAMLERTTTESFWFIVFRWFSSWFYGNIHGHLEKFVNGIDMSFWSFLLLGRRQEKEAEHSVEKPLKMSHFMFFRLCLFIWIFVDILGSFRSTMASWNIEIKISREND